jgi:hypothetical protein
LAGMFHPERVRLKIPPARRASSQEESFFEGLAGHL